MSDATARTAHYLVQGMTCEHCVNAVSSEVSALPGVTAVEVDLVSGSLQVTSDAPLARTEVATAVDEAGYALLDS